MASPNEFVTAINEQRGGGAPAPAAPVAPAGPEQDPIAGIQEIVGDDNSQNTTMDNAMDIDTLGVAVLMLTQAVAQIVQILQGAEGAPQEQVPEQLPPEAPVAPPVGPAPPQTF